MIIIYVTFPLTSVVACIFSFWVGRCARKIPVIDDDLPWTMKTMSQAPAARCPWNCMPPTAAGYRAPSAWAEGALAPGRRDRGARPLDLCR